MKRLALPCACILLTAAFVQAQTGGAAREQSVLREYLPLILVQVGTLFAAWLKFRSEMRDFKRDFQEHLLMERSIQLLKNQGKFISEDPADLGRMAKLGGFLVAGELTALEDRLKGQLLDVSTRVRVLEAAREEIAVQEGLRREAQRLFAEMDAIKRRSHEDPPPGQ